MLPIITESNSVHYFSNSDLIKFIKNNSDYEWNELVEITSDVIFNDEGKTYYPEKLTKDLYKSDFQIEWVNNFFDAHPFVKKIMFCFDD